MLSFLKKKNKQIEPVKTDSNQINSNFLQLQTGQALLSTEERKYKINIIKRNISVNEHQFNILYMSVFEHFATFCQNLPKNDVNTPLYHRYGGLIDYSLDLLSAVSKLKQNYQLPIGATSERQSNERGVWDCVLMYATVLHCTSFLFDFEIILENNQKWHLWQGSISKPYQFRILENLQSNRHIQSSLIVNQIISEQSLLWLAQYQNALESLLSVYSQSNNIILEIIRKANTFVLGEKDIITDSQNVEPKNNITRADEVIATDNIDTQEIAIQEEIDNHNIEIEESFEELVTNNDSIDENDFEIIANETKEESNVNNTKLMKALDEL